MKSYVDKINKITSDNVNLRKVLFTTSLSQLVVMRLKSGEEIGSEVHHDIDQFTPTLQKPEGFRVKAPEGEVVVLYFESSATQNLKFSGFPAGETTWQNRPYPSNSPMEVSKNLSFCYDIGNNCGPLSNLCHVVYASKGLSQPSRHCPLVCPIWLKHIPGRP